jgi:hypothetical protein
MLKHQKGLKETLATKNCIQCGRVFQYRKSLKEDWALVKFCSKGCRSQFKNSKGRQTKAKSLKNVQ